MQKSVEIIDEVHFWEETCRLNVKPDLPIQMKQQRWFLEETIPVVSAPKMEQTIFLYRNPMLNSAAYVARDNRLKIQMLPRYTRHRYSHASDPGYSIDPWWCFGYCR